MNFFIKTVIYNNITFDNNKNMIMKNLFFFILIFASINIAAQDLNSNLRVIQDKNGKLPDLIDYEIKTLGKIMSFKCKSANLDFEVNLTDTLTNITQGDYRIITMDTDNSDQIAIIYKADKLTTICIQQINGINLFYIYSEVHIKKPEEIGYRL